MKLSKKAESAINRMKDGAYWVRRLETDKYTKREQFHYRLIAAEGVVKGFGFKTHLELENAGLLRWRESVRDSQWKTEWTLR